MGLFAVGISIVERSPVLAGPGSIRISAVEAGKHAESAEVFVDGDLRCTSSPCIVDTSNPGAHLVQVVAPGYVPLGVRGVSVSAGQRSQLSFELFREPIIPGVEPEDPVDTDSLPLAAPTVASSKRRTSQVAPERRPTATRTAAPTPPAPRGEQRDTPKKNTKAVLVLDATRPSNIIIDGRPIGAAPKRVRVRAGAHTIVFAASDGTRRVLRTRVDPGAQKTLRARF